MECRYAQCRYAECRGALTLNDIKMLTTANQQFTLSIIFFTNVLKIQN